MPLGGCHSFTVGPQLCYGIFAYRRQHFPTRLLVVINGGGVNMPQQAFVQQRCHTIEHRLQRGWQVE